MRWLIFIAKVSLKLSFKIAKKTNLSAILKKISEILRDIRKFLKITMI